MVSTAPSFSLLVKTSSTVSNLLEKVRDRLVLVDANTPGAQQQNNASAIPWFPQAPRRASTIAAIPSAEADKQDRGHSNNSKRKSGGGPTSKLKSDHTASEMLELTTTRKLVECSNVDMLKLSMNNVEQTADEFLAYPPAYRRGSLVHNLTFNDIGNTNEFLRFVPEYALQKLASSAQKITVATVLMNTTTENNGAETTSTAKIAGSGLPRSKSWTNSLSNMFKSRAAQSTTERSNVAASSRQATSAFVTNAAPLSNIVGNESCSGPSSRSSSRSGFFTSLGSGTPRTSRTPNSNGQLSNNSGGNVVPIPISAMNLGGALGSATKHKHLSTGTVGGVVALPITVVPAGQQSLPRQISPENRIASGGSMGGDIDPMYRVCSTEYPVISMDSIMDTEQFLRYTPSYAMMTNVTHALVEEESQEAHNRLSRLLLRTSNDSDISELPFSSAPSGKASLSRLSHNTTALRNNNTSGILGTNTKHGYLSGCRSLKSQRSLSKDFAAIKENHEQGHQSGVCKSQTCADTNESNTHALATTAETDGGCTASSLESKINNHNLLQKCETKFCGSKLLGKYSRSLQLSAPRTAKSAKQHQAQF